MEQLLIQIIELLRAGEAIDDRRLAHLVRCANAGQHDVSKHVSKKKILPFYLACKEHEPKRWESWDVDPELEQRFVATVRTKPRRTSSGVATITVITKPWPCGSDCLYCPNDLRMPKSYLSNEPACRRAERNFFDPYLQVASRLHTLEQMGHSTSKVELIVLGGTWSDYPAEYQIWFMARMFAAMNDTQAMRRKEVTRLRKAYEEAGFAFDEERLADWSRPSQERIAAGESSYNAEWQQLYGPGSKWNDVAAAQSATWNELELLHQANESAEHRVVGLVVETRPDRITAESLLDIRRLGCTKVQIGVQSLDENILQMNCRGLQPGGIEQAFALLRLFGFKIHAHFMLNLVGSTTGSDVEGYRRFVNAPAYQPDEVKLYPCALIGGTRLVRLYKNHSWTPYGDEELLELLSQCMALTPPWTRVSRMVRDFSAEDIMAGSKKANFRQDVDQHLQRSGTAIQEIRTREIAGHELDASQLQLECVEYLTEVSKEMFLQWVTPQGGIAGFLRLSLPLKGKLRALGCDMPVQEGEAMIREVHVYGRVAAVDEGGENAQHLGLGRRLVEEACRIAAAAGYQRINVISAVGTRGYYRKLGFVDNCLYQQKSL